VVRIAALLFLLSLAAPAVAATQPLDLWTVALHQPAREDHYKTLATAGTVPMTQTRIAGRSPVWAHLAQVYLLTVAAAALAQRLPRPRRQDAAAAEASPRIR
jgi:hypothetical protein